MALFPIHLLALLLEAAARDKKLAGHFGPSWLVRTTNHDGPFTLEKKANVGRKQIDNEAGDP
jgi:hypothetical protein